MESRPAPQPERSLCLELGADRIDDRLLSLAHQEERDPIALIVVRCDHVLMRHREYQGAAAEDGPGQPLQPADDPSLAVEVVHGEDAAGLEPGPDVAERLFSEQEALEPDARVARMQ